MAMPDDFYRSYAGHRLEPMRGSWCLEALSNAASSQCADVFKPLSLIETMVLLKALPPPLRLRVLETLPLAPYIKTRLQKSFQISGQGSVPAF
jgi:hypothetical protein